MATFDQLNASTSLSSNDLFVVYSGNNGDTRKASINLLSIFLKTQLLVDIQAAEDAAAASATYAANSATAAASSQASATASATAAASSATAAATSATSAATQATASAASATASAASATTSAAVVGNEKYDNAAFDPWFTYTKSTNSVDPTGRKLVYNTSLNATYDATINLLTGSKGAWRFTNPASATLMGFYDYLDTHGINPGDNFSLGIMYQAGVGEIINTFYRPCDNTPTLLGTQVTGPILTGDGTIQIATINNITLYAAATGILTYFTKGGVTPTNFAIIAIWVVKAASAGLMPPKRITTDLWKAMTPAAPDQAKVSLMPDPFFEVMQNTSVTFGGLSYFNSAHTNRTWEPSYARTFGSLGAWKHTSGGALTGFDLPFALAGLAPGDKFSIGCILVATTVGGTPNIYHRQYIGADTNYSGVAQVTTGVDVNGAVGTGLEQVYQLNNLTVEATTTGAEIFFGDTGVNTDFHILALWVIKAANAGLQPPIHQNPYLIYTIGNNGVDPTPVVSPDAVILPTRICGIAGRSMQLLLPGNVRRGSSARGLRLAGSTAPGKINALGYLISSPSVGDYPFTVEIKNPDSGNVLGTLTPTLSIGGANTPAGAKRRVLMMGDSLTHVDAGNAAYGQTVLDVATANANSVQYFSDVAGTVPGFIGTQNAAPNLNEGHPGKRIDDHYAYYAGNPFAPNPGDLFRADNYLATNALATPQIVVITSGINEVINAPNDAAAYSTAQASLVKLDAIIGLTSVVGVVGWKGVSAGIIIILQIEPFGATNPDNWGNDYTISQGLSPAQGCANIAIFAKALTDRYTGMEAQHIFICPSHAFVDRGAAGYPASGVHPRGTGYPSMGNALSDMINWGVGTGGVM